MRFINLILAILFLTFASLQVNHPNAVLWILIYGVMAVLCILAMFEFYPKKIIISVGILYLLYAVYLFPGIKEWLHQREQVASFANVDIKGNREFLSLIVCVLVLTLHLIRSRIK